MSAAKRTSAGVYVLAVLGLAFLVVAGAATYGYGFLPDPDNSVSAHHIQHLFFVIGGGLWGLALAQWLADRGAGGKGSSAWLFLAILAPIAAMFTMWPSTYPYIEARPFLHLLEHVVFIILAALTTFAGFRFARPAGWLFGASLAAMAAAAAIGYGVAPEPSPLIAQVAAQTAAQAAQTPGQAPAQAQAQPAAPATEPAGQPAVATPAVDGAAVFAQNCAACHQAQGSGIPGAFPPLAGHLPQLLAAAGGREYVTHVLLFGLQGQISVLGQTYNGVMPAWSQLSDAEIAAVIDHEATSWGNALPAGQAPLTAGDIASQRGLALTVEQVHAARDALGLK